MRRRKSNEAGRQIPCSLCPTTMVEGSAQVYRKLLFFFCPACWLRRRTECNDFMRRVAGPGIGSGAQKAAA
jgi:hypothetical protein